MRLLPIVGLHGSMKERTRAPDLTHPGVHRPRLRGVSTTPHLSPNRDPSGRAIESNIVEPSRIGVRRVRTSAESNRPRLHARSSEVDLNPQRRRTVALAVIGSSPEGTSTPGLRQPRVLGHGAHRPVRRAVGGLGVQRVVHHLLDPLLGDARLGSMTRQTFPTHSTACRAKSQTSGSSAPTVYECDACGSRALGEQRCECGTFARRVGIGGCCPECDAPVAVEELVGPDLVVLK